MYIKGTCTTSFKAKKTKSGAYRAISSVYHCVTGPLSLVNKPLTAWPLNLDDLMWITSFDVNLSTIKTFCSVFKRRYIMDICLSQYITGVKKSLVLEPETSKFQPGQAYIFIQCPIQCKVIFPTSF